MSAVSANISWITRGSAELPLAFPVSGSYRKPSPDPAGADALGSDVFGSLLPALPLPLAFSITGSFQKPSPLPASVPPDLRAALGHPTPLVDRTLRLAPEDWGMHGVVRYLRAENLTRAISGFFFTG